MPLLRDLSPDTEEMVAPVQDGRSRGAQEPEPNPQVLAGTKGSHFGEGKNSLP